MSSEFSKKTAGIVTAFILILSFPGQASSSEVTEGMKSSIDAIISLIKNEEAGKPRRAKIEKIVNRKFDFIEMSKRALARNWNAIAPRERRKFSELFADLLRHTYISKIEKFTKEKIEYVQERTSPKGRAILKTLIVKKDDEIPVDYRMIKKGGEWFVYDFIIENVSMIRNYRSQFGKIIKESSYANLVTRMQKKVTKLQKEEDKQDSTSDEEPSHLEDI